MPPTLIVYALISGLVPSLVWVFFWLREDAQHPEPRWLLFAAFTGGMASVAAAVFFESAIADSVVNISARYILWAITEEILKFAAVTIVALHGRFYDEPIDAMIYCIMTALGFAAVENVFFSLEPISAGFIAESIVTINMRFIGATLVHTVSSALVGFALGLVFYRGHAAKIAAILVGLVTAAALHAAFNLSIINGTLSETLQAFAWIWASVVLLLVLFEEVKAVRPRIRYIR